MFNKLGTQILKMLLGAKMTTSMTTSITEDCNIIRISAVEEFQHSDHSKHYRTISITMTEEVK